MTISLAIKYRPKTWDDVVAQSSTKIILQQQLQTGTFKHAYLFCGPAGCGKTTCARIFANEINKGSGNPIELDAASNNGVDSVREIIQQAKTRSLDSEYKVFIIDECHALSNSAWQAMLKIIEEPPAKSIFIFCTTDPQKIPATIISRVQRYDFQRISQDSIVKRLDWICANEEIENPDRDIANWPALEYIAKLADGGMRDAITMLDKCLSYSEDLTLENVISALGLVSYEFMFSVTTDLMKKRTGQVISSIETIYADGVDLKQFIKSYIQFLMDIAKYQLRCDSMFINLPMTETNEQYLAELDDYDFIMSLLSTCVKLSERIKYSATPKMDIESAFMLLIYGETL